jgi:glycosyltransferase involved in cell wall biosynthesis
MKLLFLHRFKDVEGVEREFGGAERQLVDLVCGLQSRGHLVTLVTFYPGGGMLADAANAGVRIISLDKTGRWDIPGFLFRLVRILRSERPDIVHGYLGLANSLLALTRPVHRAKVVWGIRASDLDLTRYHWVARVDAWLERRLSRLPDLIIANSHAGKRHATDLGYPAAKITVIPNGIDLDHFRRDETGRDRVRAEWGVRPGEFLVGRIGRIDPQKDQPTFLEAAARVAAARNDVRFVLVGNDRFGEQDEITSLLDRLILGDLLFWAFHRSDMAAVLSAFDLCVSSSAFGEGTPNVLVEAMACGTPCVTTDVGDSAQAVGAHGIVVPRRDPAALADGILTALDQPTDRTALRSHVADHFSMERLIAATEAALLELRAPTARANRAQAVQP